MHQIKIRPIYHEKNTKSKKSWNSTIFTVLIVIILFFAIFSQQSIYVISKIVAPKIVSVNNMAVYINQNDKFDLPSQIAAKMSYGGDKAVVVNWNIKRVNPSTVGTKLINGKINGYGKTVFFKITILPNQLHQTINDSIVENSIIRFNIKLSKTIKRVWFKVCKGNDLIDQFVAVTNGSMICSVYLPFGSGDYQVTFLTSTSNNEDDRFDLTKDIIVRNKDTRDMSFLMPSIYVQSDSNEIRNLAYKITEGRVSNMDKTKSIHDWVSSNIAYDVKALSNNIHEYSAIETFKGKKALCNGYANLTAALNRSIGIKCKIIGGTVKAE